ncbi:hypothetical protein AK812_SmicGene2500 [Symbiodinium microadriaticum]|uniref:Uncharacterized protein n=1 Tax=Symbiodinium microadriaticum TaxID=2951 RepID=A0A1Q9F1D0_SYMMI|nr:hypothetical protein AK812_SmicGene2500 [Symbiodinium microadriaticum]
MTSPALPYLFSLLARGCHKRIAQTIETSTSSTITALWSDLMRPSLDPGPWLRVSDVMQLGASAAKQARLAALRERCQKSEGSARSDATAWLDFAEFQWSQLGNPDSRVGEELSAPPRQVREKQRAVLEAALAKQPLGAITGAFETPMEADGAAAMPVQAESPWHILAHQFRFKNILASKYGIRAMCELAKQSNPEALMLAWNQRADLLAARRQRLLQCSHAWWGFLEACMMGGAGGKDFSLLEGAPVLRGAPTPERMPAPVETVRKVPHMAVFASRGEFAKLGFSGVNVIHVAVMHQQQLVTMARQLQLWKEQSWRL